MIGMYFSTFMYNCAHLTDVLMHRFPLAFVF